LLVPACADEKIPTMAIIAVSKRRLNELGA
jgi:hypothetical protein